MVSEFATARAVSLFGSCLLLALGTGCNTPPSTDDYVARVGEHYLTREELQSALQSSASPLQDSTVTRQQIVERWVENELLYQEAQRRGLRNDDEVQRLLLENERSVMISALLSELYEENIESPGAAEIRAYYEQHKEQLRLREPFARVQFLPVRVADSADAAHDQVRLLGDAANPDSLWEVIIDRYGADPEGSRTLSNNYYPESRLFRSRPVVREALMDLDPGETAPVITDDNGPVILRLAERAQPGTEPQIAWIEEDLGRRLQIQGRKQMYARQVQRLRNEALAQENLDIR
jgi:hypothetical protein